MAQAYNQLVISGDLPPGLIPPSLQRLKMQGSPGYMEAFTMQDLYRLAWRWLVKWVTGFQILNCNNNLFE
jgi:hypothetical protein